MKILLIDPYFTGSHRQWAEGYKRFSSHEVEILSLPGKHWKWRMHGAAVTCALELERLGQDFDLILATDMMDLAVFRGLANGLKVPVALYMHENQLMYPWSDRDSDLANQRDNHYGFINYTSCLAADKVFFNSKFHMDGFIEAAEVMLKRFPDHREIATINDIKQKSEVLGVGLDLRSLAVTSATEVEERSAPTVLWNHRWEHDKNPTEFFEALIELKQEGILFNLAVLGESFSKTPTVFQSAREKLADSIIHWGYCADRTEYAQWLNQSDFLPITSNHDFFGVSVVEAMYCGVTPLLPNRLAYPEHLHSSELSTHLYEEGDFASALRELVRNWKPSDSQYSNSVVSDYDWANMAPEYDTRFSDLVNR